MQTLCQAMKTREDYDEDMQVLWHIMEKGAKNNKKSVDVMLVKIRELNNGSFIGSLPIFVVEKWQRKTVSFRQWIFSWQRNMTLVVKFTSFFFALIFYQPWKKTWNIWEHTMQMWSWGKDLLDPEIKDFAWKYNLDDQLLHRLIKTMKIRGKHKSQAWKTFGKLQAVWNFGTTHFGKGQKWLKSEAFISAMSHLSLEI